MFSFLKRWNSRAGNPVAGDEPRSISDNSLDALPDDDLEAVVGGLANSEQVLRSLRALHEAMKNHEAGPTPWQQ